MPSSPVAPVQESPSSRCEQVRALTEQVPRFLRLGHAVKSSMAAQGNERAALVRSH